jgi:dipeptidase E
MKGRLFLASSINFTGKDIAEKIGGDVTRLKTAFITTAAEGEGPGDMSWLDNDRKGLLDGGFDLFDYTLTDKTSEDIEKDLGDCDVIHVNGGNTFYLLVQARESGFDEFIKKFVDKGGIYIGSSAGSVIASPDIYITRKLETKIYEKELKSFEGFGLVDFIVLPHWASKVFRELYLNHRLDVAYVKGNKIILLTDSQYVLVEGDMYKIIGVGDV